MYAGCKDAINYRGKDVTPKNFMHVLLGEKTEVPDGKPVLESTSGDRVFVNFVDHGGTGIIAFPGGGLFGQKLLHAADLVQTLTTMHSNNMYKELVFYMEACESGSMFAKLPKNLNIYATTAANAKESSWGTYCPPHDKVNGKELHTCLGDLYSVNWMENDDSLSNLDSETLEVQYQKVKKLTNKSHVLQFGSLAIDSEEVGAYEGDKDKPTAAVAASAAADSTDRGVKLLHYFGFRGRALLSANDDGEDKGGAASSSPSSSSLSLAALKDASAVDSRDIALVSLFYKYLRTGEGAEALVDEVKSRESADKLFKKVAVAVFGAAKGAELAADGLNMDPESTACHKTVNQAVAQFCGGYTDYSLKHSRIVVNMCETLDGVAQPIVQAMQAICAA